MPGIRILGVDFTSAPRRAKPITVAVGKALEDGFALHALERIGDWAGFEALLARPGPWLGGFDFPFGLPREAVGQLGWPLDWHGLTAHCARLGRERFRAALDEWRAPRPVGSKYAHRATDRPANSHSPLKLVNPPVGLMFLEGAPRLAAAGVTVPGLCGGDPARIALEAYPALLARRVLGRESYKNDTVAKQTPARRAARARLVSALSRAEVPGHRLEGDCGLLRELVRDPSGDALDAVLAAIQAARAWQLRMRHYGLPEQVDPIEGWILGAPPIP
jgi:hypothetical protein